MKKESHKHIPLNNSPRIKYVKAAHAWVMTFWDDQGNQREKFFSDEKCEKPIVFSEKK